MRRVFLRKTRRGGMTLVELVVTLAIMIVLTGVFTLGFLRQGGRSSLDITAKKAGTLLREAQARSAAREGVAAWGVHFENAAGSERPFYALFISPYSSPSAVEKQSLPPDVAYATSSIPAGDFVEVLFAAGTGIPVAARVIDFELYRNLKLIATTSLTVAEQGLISY